MFRIICDLEFELVMRKHPLPKMERAIAGRLTKLRKLAGLSRAELSSRAGIGPDLLARVELGRMPLRYVDARRLLIALAGGEAALFSINPHWLGFGRGLTQLNWPLLLPEFKEIGLNSKSRFSEFATDNRALLAGLAAEPPWAELPEFWLSSYTMRVAGLRAQVARAESALAIFENVLTFSKKRRGRSRGH